MKAWFTRLFTSAPKPTSTPSASEASSAAAPAGPRAAALAPQPAAPAQARAGGRSNIDVAFLCWLVDQPGAARAQTSARETRALQVLDHLASDAGAHQGVLPRAAAVVPQLLARLRDAASSSSQLAEYVTRDVTLVAEVMRISNSAHYRRGEPVVELGHAIRLVGHSGLQSAIARSVLRPVFDARGGELVTRTAKRLWEHTQHKAQLCAALARSEGQDPFEGYLMGLVHNAVWSAVLRSLDGVESNEPWSFSPTLVMALGLRRDRLFEIIARKWQLSESLTRVAADVAGGGLAEVASVQGRVLAAGDRLASLVCIPNLSSDETASMGSLGESVRQCFEDSRREQSAASV